jgi:hypothetical protein
MGAFATQPDSETTAVISNSLTNIGWENSCETVLVEAPDVTTGDSYIAG